MKSHTLKILSFFALPMLVLLVGFQNCSKIPEGGGGNGDSYGGIDPQTPPGFYYARRFGFVCPAGSRGPSIPGITNTIRIFDEGGKIDRIDNCTGVATSLNWDQLRMASLGSQYFGHNNEVYEGAPAVPNPEKPIPVLICETVDPIEETSGPNKVLTIQHVVTADYVAHVLAVFRAFTTYDPRTRETLPDSVGPDPVVMGTGQYPTGSGTSSTTFTNPGLYFLNISSLGDLSSGDRPAEFRGTIRSRVLSGPTRCIHPGFVTP